MCFEEYTNFKAHYLSRCRDIPLQSFGSHICPQPHGLGFSELCLVKVVLALFSIVRYTLCDTYINIPKSATSGKSI